MIISLADINNKKYFINSNNIVYLQPINKSNSTAINFSSRVINFSANEVEYIIRLTNNETIQVTRAVGITVITEMTKEAGGINE